MKLDKIKEIVEIETDSDLKVKSRQREIVYARSIYYKLCKTHTRATLSSIGKSVKKDHATVLHGLRLFDDVITKYEDAQDYKRIHGKLDRMFRNKSTSIERFVDPSNYYRQKYKDALLELRKVRNENRMLKKQLTL
jgi:hypothetical protein|tara:strand:- start:671 stop:1078 length:408 start_codon:yes stop_codon:yes gene_type:complete